jgi:hypothetical protein
MTHGSKVAKLVLESYGSFLGRARAGERMFHS